MAEGASIVQKYQRTLQQLRKAFERVSAAASEQSDKQRAEALQSLNDKAGRVLYALVDKGLVNPPDFPEKLRESPTLVPPGYVMNGDEMDYPPPDEVFYIYWEAFIGWAADRADIPINSTELFTRRVFMEYEPGTHMEAMNCLWQGTGNGGSLLSPICRASLDTVDYLLESLGRSAQTEGSLGTILPLNKENGEWVPQTARTNSAANKGSVIGFKKSQARHSPDFRSVSWYGNEYTFTPTQAAIVKILWENWEHGTPEISDSSLMEAVDSTTSRIVDIFRKCPAWSTMIVQGHRKGSRRLNPPDNS